MRPKQFWDSLDLKGVFMAISRTEGRKNKGHTGWDCGIMGENNWKCSIKPIITLSI
jgi:hypothetical protein